MKPIVKVAIVVGGYILALLAAVGAVALHSAAVSETDSRPSDGMSAFGDLVLFAAVFGLVAAVPTVAAFLFLWPRKKPPAAKGPGA